MKKKTNVAEARNKIKQMFQAEWPNNHVATTVIVGNPGVTPYERKRHYTLLLVVKDRTTELLKVMR